MHRRSEPPAPLPDETVNVIERLVVSLLCTQDAPAIRSYPRGGAIDRLMVVLVNRIEEHSAQIYKPVYGGIFYEEAGFTSCLSWLSQEGEGPINGAIIIYRSKHDGREKYDEALNYRLGVWEQGILAYCIHEKLFSEGIKSRIQARIGWTRGVAILTDILDDSFDLEYPLLIVY